MVADINAPDRPDDGKGINGVVMKRAMTKAGVARPTANRITLLRDTNTAGSNSNIGENGMHNEQHRAAILAVTIATRNVRVFASGLRNPDGLAWNPDSGMLWTVVNERDELGNHLVPGYMTSMQDGAFYG